MSDLLFLFDPLAHEQGCEEHEHHSLNPAVKQVEVDAERTGTTAGAIILISSMMMNAP